MVFWVNEPSEVVQLVKEESFKKLVLISFLQNSQETSQNLLTCLEELEDSNQNILLACLDSDRNAGLVEFFNVAKVPTTLAYLGVKQIGRFEGANVPEIVSNVEYWSTNFETEMQNVQQEYYEKIRILINKHPMMLFIKGTPQNPQCKFTRRLMSLIGDQNFGHFNILADDGVREWMKKYSEWPTYPQVYLNGEMLGGVDIVEQMVNSGEFPSTQDLEHKLKSLVNQSKVVLFMKGSPENPLCGFSQKAVEMLRKNAAKFSHFDILEDNEVREGLKAYSSWPTYPQLYVDGELIGGVDIMSEMDASGELSSVINKS